MITSSTIPEEDRRTAVRELSHISSASYADAALDRKIEDWDDTALAYFGAQGVTLTGDELYFKSLIKVANLLTAIAILAAIGTIESIATAKEYATLYRSIVKAQHKREPEQNAYHLEVTRGIDRYEPRGDFN